MVGLSHLLVQLTIAAAIVFQFCKYLYKKRIKPFISDLAIKSLRPSYASYKVSQLLFSSNEELLSIIWSLSNTHLMNFFSAFVGKPTSTAAEITSTPRSTPVAPFCPHNRGRRPAPARTARNQAGGASPPKDAALGLKALCGDMAQSSPRFRTHWPCLNLARRMS